MTTGGLVVLLVGMGVVLCLVALAAAYNRFVQQTTLTEESWSQVDVELQRRHDLIPNLVTTVKAYAAHEAAVLQRVTEARAVAEQHRGAAPAERRAYEEEVGLAVADVLAVAEGYPELRASINYLQLQRELTDTEDRIAAARRFYNGNVRALNTRVGTFPSNLVASTFGFGRKEFFEPADPAASSPPAVS